MGRLWRSRHSGLRKQFPCAHHQPPPSQSLGCWHRKSSSGFTAIKAEKHRKFSWNTVNGKQLLSLCINKAIQPKGYKSTTHEHGGEVCLQKHSPHLTFLPGTFPHQFLSFGWGVAIIELYGKDSPWPRNTANSAHWFLLYRLCTTVQNRFWRRNKD